MKISKIRIFRWIVYFRRGHNAWLVYLVSFANFIVIQYRLLIEYVKPLEVIFSSLTFFAVAFFLTYVPIATLIGWIDTKKATVPREMEVNPYFIYPVAKERKFVIPLMLIMAKTLEKLALNTKIPKEELTDLKEVIQSVESWLEQSKKLPI